MARELWSRYELIHDLTYFSPHARRHADALGLRGFWMGYFAMRAGPLGTVPPEVVTATFYGFHPSRVRRALPDAWDYTTPEQAIAARTVAMDEALAELDLADEAVAEAADLLGTAAAAADTAGRPLAAANQALPRPRSDRAALWQATTVLREHRGDGHIAVLVSRGISPVEAHQLKIGADESDVGSLKAGRGYPDGDWAAATAALRSRGWTDPTGALTDAGRAEHLSIEAATDRAGEQPWTALGPAATRRLLDLLDPITTAVVRTELIPQPNPVGIRWTG